MKTSNRKGRINPLSRLDQFAPEVSLTFKGERQFKTWFGGAASLLTITLFLGIVMLKAQGILEGYETTSFFTTKTTRDINEPIDLMKLDYTFAVTRLDPSIAVLNVR